MHNYVHVIDRREMLLLDFVIHKNVSTYRYYIYISISYTNISLHEHIVILYTYVHILYTCLPIQDAMQRWRLWEKVIKYNAFVAERD